MAFSLAAGGGLVSHDDCEGDVMADATIDFDELGEPTDMAHRVIIDDDTFWLPKSLCEVDEDAKTATGPEWFMKQKGLI